MKISWQFSLADYSKNPSKVITVHEKLQTTLKCDSNNTQIAAASFEGTVQYVCKDFSLKHYGSGCVEDIA